MPCGLGGRDIAFPSHLRQRLWHGNTLPQSSTTIPPTPNPVVGYSPPHFSDTYTGQNGGPLSPSKIVGMSSPMYAIVVSYAVHPCPTVCCPLWPVSLCHASLKSGCTTCYPEVLLGLGYPQYDVSHQLWCYTDLNGVCTNLFIGDIHHQLKPHSVNHHLSITFYATSLAAGHDHSLGCSTSTHFLTSA